MGVVDMVTDGAVTVIGAVIMAVGVTGCVPDFVDVVRPGATTLVVECINHGYPQTHTPDIRHNEGREQALPSNAVVDVRN